MKVLLINGSPHKAGCTFTALDETARALNAEGVETEIVWIGHKPVRGCDACGNCSKNGTKRCIFDDDVVNGFIEKAESADGIIVGSPVYYAGPNGALCAVLDRMFYAGGSTMRFKPAAAIASARRAGTTVTLDRLLKYFTINCMPVVSSNYWPMTHGAGNAAEQAKSDEEGMQIMRVLGKNMAWMLKCIQAGAAAGIDAPTLEAKVMTNFIR